MQSSGQDPATPGMGKPPPTLLDRIKVWDNQFSVAKGLTVITLLTGFLGGYFQYLNAYEEKVSAQAKADMTDATATFVDISNAFAEAQTLQELVFFNFAGWLDESDANQKEMVAAAAHQVFPDYVKARISLREKSRVFSRKAEMYIDWASDLGRDPSARHELNTDPLTEALLGDYNFDCDDRSNFPRFENANKQGEPGKDNQNSCGVLRDSSINLCARDDDGRIISTKKPITINWQSAKHHVLTMHYCFGISHNRIRAARAWAASKDASVSDKVREDFQKNSATYKSHLDNQVTRLNAFMSLAMSQLERIRVKYRPSSFYCHLPVVRDAVGIFSEKCTPVGTAAGKPF